MSELTQADLDAVALAIHRRRWEKDWKKAPPMSARDLAYATELAEAAIMACDLRTIRAERDTLKAENERLREAIDVAAQALADAAATMRCHIQWQPDEVKRQALRNEAMGARQAAMTAAAALQGVSS